MNAVFPHVPRSALDADAAELYDRILETRGPTATTVGLIGPDGSMRGPFGPLLLTPKLGDLVQRLGVSVKSDTTLSAATFETVALTVSRTCDCAFEWSAHRLLAVSSGALDKSDVESISSGLPPRGSDGAAVAWSFTKQQCDSGEVDEATLASAIACFGERGVVELTVVTGYYILIAMLVGTCGTSELPTSQKAREP